MRDRLPATAGRVKDAFGAFTPGQKAVTLIGIIALVVGGYFFVTWAGRPTYAPLFSNLSTTDASAIVDKLSAGGTSYQLTDGGTTILVPQDQVYDLRLKMSGAGLPAAADTGYSLLDKQGITTSEFMQQVSYQRALEGELAKTIQSIDGVQAATVHLAIPRRDVFADDQAEPTASVLVSSAAGNSLTQGQVQAIVHLVAASVEGLDPQQVTVAGADGRVLTAGGADFSGVDATTRDQQTAAFEQRMSNALQQMVDSVVGPGHAVVKTTADLDYDQTETKSQTYLASPSAPPLAESNSVETYTGDGTAAGGVLGPDNIQVPTPGTTLSPGQYYSSTQTRDNAISSVTETRRAAPGGVRRLNVSVLLDSAVQGVPPAQVQQMITAAAGLDATRGDAVAVTVLPFDQTVTKQNQQALAQAQATAQRQQWISMAKIGALALVLLFLLFKAWRYSRRAKKAAKQRALEAAQRAELEAAERVAALAAAQEQAALAAAGQSPALTAGPDREARQREIAMLVERQPEDIALLLRGWLADRRS